jgi:hypothetical protein
MKTRTLIIALALSIGVYTACTDKKKAEGKAETEILTKAHKTTTEDTVDKAEKRRLDSMRQVKEHGHAH